MNNNPPVDKDENPLVDKDNTPTSDVMNSSSKGTKSEDRSNETWGSGDTSSKAKKGRFVQLVLHSLHSCAKRSRNHLLFPMIVINSPSKISYLS